MPSGSVEDVAPETTTGGLAAGAAGSVELAAAEVSGLFRKDVLSPEGPQEYGRTNYAAHALHTGGTRDRLAMLK